MALIEFRSIVQTLSGLGANFINLAQASSGTTVNRDTAMSLSAVYACVQVISNDLGGLPLHVMQKLPNGGAKKLPDDDLYRLLKVSPNAEMRPLVWKRTRLAHVLLQGYAYAIIERTIVHPVSNLWTLDPDQVSIKRIDGPRNRRGLLYYEVQDGYTTKRYNSSQILHLKGYSWDGLVGQSIITTYAKNQIGIGLELDLFEANFFKNGLNPGGIFKHPRAMNEKVKTSFLDSVRKRFSSSKNSKMPMVLEGGMDFVPYSVKMVDQQFIELLKLNKTDICSIFGVPQSRVAVADSNTNYNNTEQEKRRYYESGLKPWAVQDEEELNFKLLTESERRAGKFIKYNFDAFLRGDAKSRAEVAKTWWQMGVPTNDALDLEDRNPVEGGDVGRVQLNTMGLKNIDEVQERSVLSASHTEYRDKGSLMVTRDQIQTTFRPIIQAAVQSLVDYEIKELLPLLDQRSAFDTTMAVFYKDFEREMRSTIAPSFTSFAEQIHEAICKDMNLDVNMAIETRQAVDQYITNFMSDYKSSSIGQLKAQSKKGVDEVRQRIEEWDTGRVDGSPSRAVKAADRHTVSLDGRVVRSVVFAAGLSLIWHTRGSKPCPYCAQLDGTVISEGQTFLAGGDSLRDAAGGVLRPNGAVRYPQLHAGCTCYVSWA